MHIHILGICGTFMGGIAAIAKDLGHKVSGSDLNVYPPMSTQLETLGIELTQGWDVEQFTPQPDMVIIGNALSRGNPAVEYVLNRKLPYCSGPEWLKNHLLKDRWVLAVSGTHGKTTTTTMLAWILEFAGFNPGYLIGGVPNNLPCSARAGSDPFFVIEADEYDTAFFDKRSKFVHYLPNTLIINNLEFDHADIFDNLAAIQKQFHHLLRTVPSNGKVIFNQAQQAIQDVLKMGCWSTQEAALTEQGWHAQSQSDGGEQIYFANQKMATLHWSVLGQHNLNNALMAIAAARHAGIEPQLAVQALQQFKAPKRRLELLFEHSGIKLYDDFAHHPTAIASTLQAIKNVAPNNRLIALIEPRSNTMKMGVHKATLAESWQLADHVLLYQDPNWAWQLSDLDARCETFSDPQQIGQRLLDIVEPGDHIVLMSNGSFGGLNQSLPKQLSAKLDN